MKNRIKLRKGDCIEIMKKIPDRKIDLIVTDPPYLMEYKSGIRKDKTHRFNKEIINDNNEEFVKQYIKECFRILKDNSAMYMFCNSNKIDVFKRACEETGFKIKNIIVWQKKQPYNG